MPVTVDRIPLRRNDTPNRRGARIVTRLRLVSLAIVALLAVGVLVGGAQLSSLKRLQSEAVSEQVAALVLSSELQSGFAQIAALAAQVGDGVATVHDDSLRARARTLLTDLRAAVQRLSELGRGGRARTELIASVDGLAIDLADALDVANRVELYHTAIAADERRIDELRERFRTIAEPARASAASEMARALDAAVAAGRLDANQGDAIDRAYRVHDALTALSNAVDSVADTAATLSRLGRSAGDVAPAADRLRFELRGLTATVLRIEDDALRRAVVAPIAALRTAVLGDDGLLVDERRLAHDLADMGLVQERLRMALAGLSTLVDRGVADVEAAAARTALELDRRTDVAVTVLVVTGVLVVLIIALTGYLVVERQVARRLSILAAEVLRIASGDDDRPVELDGPDEIGEIGRSLKVFRENARELRRSNEELETFAYAAAHDMRSPLRAIESLAQWTLEDEADALSDDGRENLETLLQRTHRLSTLQSDLLDYAQVGEIDGSLDVVELRPFVQEIGALVDPQQRFELVCEGADAPVRTHVVPLRQILMNLIGNAIKHHDGERGRIVVAWRTVAARLIVSVTDDGPGIDPQFHANVFALFTTLQSKDEVESSGLGLAMVRRLVERYEGTIDIDSDPERGRGTTFRCDLPNLMPTATPARAA